MDGETNEKFSTWVMALITIYRLEPNADGDIQRPPKPTHQRSLSISRPDSPKPLALRHSLPTPTDGVLSTWEGASTPNSGEEAPPLPPRGCSKYQSLNKIQGKEKKRIRRIKVYLLFLLQLLTREVFTLTLVNSLLLLPGDLSVKRLVG